MLSLLSSMEEGDDDDEDDSRTGILRKILFSLPMKFVRQAFKLAVGEVLLTFVRYKCFAFVSFKHHLVLMQPFLQEMEVRMKKVQFKRSALVKGLFKNDRFGFSKLKSGNSIMLEWKLLLVVFSKMEAYSKLLKEFTLLDNFWKRNRAFMPLKLGKSFTVCFDMSHSSHSNVALLWFAGEGFQHKVHDHAVMLLERLFPEEGSRKREVIPKFSPAVLHGFFLHLFGCSFFHNVKEVEGAHVLVRPFHLLSSRLESSRAYPARCFHVIIDVNDCFGMEKLRPEIAYHSFFIDPRQSFLDFVLEKFLFACACVPIVLFSEFFSQALKSSVFMVGFTEAASASLVLAHGKGGHGNDASMIVKVDGVLARNLFSFGSKVMDVHGHLGPWNGSAHMLKELFFSRLDNQSKHGISCMRKVFSGIFAGGSKLEVGKNKEPQWKVIFTMDQRSFSCGYYPRLGPLCCSNHKEREAVSLSGYQGVKYTLHVPIMVTSSRLQLDFGGKSTMHQKGKDREKIFSDFAKDFHGNGKDQFLVHGAAAHFKGYKVPMQHDVHTSRLHTNAANFNVSFYGMERLEFQNIMKKDIQMLLSKLPLEGVKQSCRTPHLLYAYVVTGLCPWLLFLLFHVFYVLMSTLSCISFYCTTFYFNENKA